MIKPQLIDTRVNEKQDSSAAAGNLVCLGFFHARPAVCQAHEAKFQLYSSKFFAENSAQKRMP